MRWLDGITDSIDVSLSAAARGFAELPALVRELEREDTAHA